MEAEEIALREYGLSDNEIRVYLSTLVLGLSSANEIAKKANMLRTTAYEVLKTLSQKGLISITLKDNVSQFSATSPSELIQILDERKKNLQAVLPKLKEMQKNLPSTLKIESFSGIEGMKTITNDLLSGKNYTYKVFGGAKSWLNFSKSFVDIFYRKKKEQKISSKAIDSIMTKKDPEGKAIIKSDRRYLKDINFTAGCFIYLDKIAFVDYEKEQCRGVIIQDKEFNQLMNCLFDNAWKIAKP